MDVIFWLWIVALLVFALRNELVFRARMRSIDVASARADADINAGKYGMVGKHWGDKDSFGTYGEMVLDLRKWTYKQFFPGFE